MKIIRWLFGHSFLIMLIVVVIYGYMFWGNLLGKDTPAGKVVAYLSSEFVVVDEFVDAVKAKQAQLNGNDTSIQKPSEVSSSTEAASVDLGNTSAVPDAAETVVMVKDSDIQSSKESHTEHRPDSVNTDHVQKSMAQTPDSEIKAEVLGLSKDSQGDSAKNEADSTTQEVEATEGDVKQAFVPPEIEKQLESVDDQGKVLSDAQRSAAVKANWITARKFFYQRNYDLSEQNYRDVIDRTVDNFDAYGELGNVYFNQGKKQQAATAYFEAAAILVRQGQIKRAKSMVGLLHHLDKDKAHKLQQLIDAALS